MRTSNLVDHEDVDDFGTNQPDESIKENVLDESSQSFYQTPESKGAMLNRSTMAYEFRETPLRCLHQNGRLPYRETRSITTFNKRKSYSHRKSNHFVKPQLKDDEEEEESKPFNLSQLNQVLNDALTDAGEQINSKQQQQTITMESPSNHNDEEKPLADEQNIANDKIIEDLLSETEEEEEKDEAVDNFHEISADELEQTQLSTKVVDSVKLVDLEKSFKRQSYVVTSPVVRFVVDEEKDFEKANNSVVNLESDVMMQTPPPPALNDNEQRKLKIKNRKATPMFGILRKETRLSSLDKSKDRSQKYWKRFSRTLDKDDDGKILAVDAKPEKSIETNKKPSDNIIVGKENRKQPVNVRIEDCKITPPAKKSITTTTAKSFSMAAINRLSALPDRIKSERPSQRYVSMAEQTQRFLNSARQYQPKGLWKRNKLTKPRPPRLLTAIRSECRRRIEAEANRVAVSSSSSLETTDGAATKTTTAVKESKPIVKVPLIQQFKNKSTKRPLTKTRTPNFCTEYRSKMYQLKHRDDQ
ncbi:hypothetical protein BLA29_001855, partial [Euroglyphus maynei]